MALKKAYATGTKYLYVKAEWLGYSKDRPIPIQIQVYEKDSAIPTHIKRVGESQNYLIGRPETNDPFSIEEMSKVDANPIKAIYAWIKENLELYRDFIDC